ncbi:MAG: DUF2752 domain-containing protein [Cyanophyceae cyanobacterium]
MQRKGYWKYYLGLGLASGLGAAMVGFSAFDSDLPLPHCLIQAFLGFPSPSCGLTRSIRALAQGNLVVSLWYHLFGLPIVGLTFLWGTIAVLKLCRQPLGEGPKVNLWMRLVKRETIIVAPSLFLTYYAVRLAAFYNIGVPSLLGNSVFWRFLETGAKAL